LKFSERRTSEGVWEVFEVVEVVEVVRNYRWKDDRQLWSIESDSVTFFVMVTEREEKGRRTISGRKRGWRCRTV
jgi:hypothetical protein